VAALEAQLGVALFTRSPGGLVATEVARGLVPHAEAMETAFAALTRAATPGGDAGQLRGAHRVDLRRGEGGDLLRSQRIDLRFAE
jgi:DNA-binding transcriptional LysR family regulator